MRAKLNQNENPYDVPDEIKNDILDSMRRISWTRYPLYDPPPLREAIAKRFGLSADQVLLGNGSNQLLFTMGMAVIAPGDPVAVIAPSFSLFELVAGVFGGKVVASPLLADFTVDADNLIDASRSAKLMMLCSPNNPTGKTIPVEILESILKSTSGLVLWDEAYAEFAGFTAAPLLARYPNLLILRTFSKAFGLAGIRIGCLLGNPELVAEIRKVHQPYNLNLFSGLVAEKILERPDWVDDTVRRILKEREKLFSRMQGIPGVIVWPSEANFILFRVPDGKAMLKSLRNESVLVRNMGSYPMCENCLRVTVGTPEENDLFIESLKKLLGS
jgi:histidinol-phosphate aminotransferase